MRNLNRLVWAAVVAGALSSPAFAQQGGGGQGGGGLGGGGQGGGGLGGGGQGGGGQGGGGLGSGGQGGQTQGTQLTQMEQAPTITAPGSTTGGGAGGGGVQDPIFARTAGNPMYQGMDANARSNAGPGGFGTPLYTTSAGTATGGRTGARAGGLGGRAGGGLNTGTEFGTIISMPVQLSYPAVPRFPAAPIASAPQLQADLAGMIGRSPMIANPAGVQVLTEGQRVILRGAAKDADEARMIAGMVRMTPGVLEVQNELAVPRR